MKTKHFWLCLKCNKEYNNDNAKYMDNDKRIAGLKVIDVCCPYCSASQQFAKWLKDEVLK